MAFAGFAQTSLKTYTSADGLFRFKYPDALIDCMPQQAAAGSKTPGLSTTPSDHPAGPSISDSCISQGSSCDGPGSEGNALACFAYPKDKLNEKPNFIAATFFVSAIQSAKTEIDCLKGSPDWFVISPKASTTTINDVSFEAFEIGDNWAGGGQSGPAYRTFHDGKCYELGIQTVTSCAEHDPGTVKEFTKKDRAEVEGRLSQALNSFVFLK